MLKKVDRSAAEICHWIRLIASYLDLRDEIFAEYPQFKQGRHPKASHFEYKEYEEPDSPELLSDDSDEDFKPSKKDQFKWSHVKDYALLSANNEFDEEMGELFERCPPGQGDEFTSVKPWLGAIKKPANAPENPIKKAPKEDLQMEWVYGYRSE